MKNKKRILAFWLAFSMAFSLAGCGVENSENEKSKHWEKLKAENAESSDTEGITGNTNSTVSDTTSDDNGKADSDNSWEKASTTAYGKYPELVTYTLGQLNGANNSNLPEGNTYEDNAYTRYLKEILNVQNQSIYMEREDRYNDYVNVLVNDHTLPDVLVVCDRETLYNLVENDLIEDLTEVYANCTSPRIKAMYNSYGSQLLGAGTFDGKLMALPEAVIDHGPCLLWLRKDWMEQLGLEEPESFEEGAVG